MLCADVAGKDKLAESYGMLQTLCGLGAMCGTPLSGEFYYHRMSLGAISPPKSWLHLKDELAPSGGIKFLS